MNIDKLKKEYTGSQKKVRRFLANLFRPIWHDRSESILNQHLMAYIMFSSFIISFILYEFDIVYHYLPFVICWSIIPLVWLYFKILPLSWNEMYEYEKSIFREIWLLPRKWDPYNKKYND